MKLSQLLEGLCKKINQEVHVTGLQIDSRCIEPGHLFIAYPGLQTDGRRYIEEAVIKGAAAVIYDPDDYEPPHHFSIPMISVPELLCHTSDIAARFYEHPALKMNMIGITGTNGKTSCAQFIAQALRRQNVRCGVVGTLGYGFLPHLQQTNHTTPDSVECQRILSEMYKKTTDAVAMEVSSHALVQHRVDAVHFNIAVFTQLSRDHLDYHGDMRSYGLAKELLFRKPGLNYGVINGDDEWGRALIERHKSTLSIIRYSLSNQSDAEVPSVLATKITPESNGFSVFVQTPWGNGEFKTALLGRFNISNLLAVLAVVCLCEVPLSEALSALSQLRTVRGRMEWIEKKDPHQPQVVVDYAHTPDALQKALSALREHCKGQLICAFGCGGNRDRGKRPQMAAVAEECADVVILTTDNPRQESPSIIIEDMMVGLKHPERAVVLLDRAEAIRYAVQKATQNDIVLVAGKGHEITQCIGDTLYPFDDVEIVKHFLSANDT
jgi:UDP-N-acetylmuramoyl-L-alanyl-D-glutamate--2,6-diaminopimelate ligase